MRLILVLALVACSDKKAEKTVAEPPLALTLSDEGLGPITATTKANVDTIAPLLPAGLTAKPDYAPGLGSEMGLDADVHIFAGDELVAIIIPGDDGNAYAMRIASPRIVSDRGWKTNVTITDPSVVAGCSCIGDGLACYRDGGRVGVILDEDCQAKYMDGSAGDVERYRKLSRGDDTALATIRGRKVRLLTWSRERFKR